MAEAKRNLLAPSTAITERLSDLLVMRETTVIIDVSECYPIVEWQDGEDGRRQKVEMWGLGRPALDRIANAGGITWENETGIIGRPTQEYLCYRAVGSMTLPDGTKVRGIGTTEWFESEEVDPIREAIVELTDAAKKNPGDKKAYGKLQGKKKQLHDARAYRLGMTETKAKNRAIRSLLGIKAKYTLDEIEQPFVVKHIDFSPNLANPDVKELMKAGVFGGVGSLYGGGGRPAIGPTEPAALPEHVAPEESTEWHPVVEEDEVADFETVPAERPPGVDEDGVVTIEEPPACDDAEFLAATEEFRLPATSTFSGKTLAEVEAEKPGYCRWMIDHGKGDEVTRAAMLAYLGE